MALHPELHALLIAIDAAEADARTLVTGLTDAQGNWQPGGGARWSIAQCLDHLATINRFYVSPFLQAAEAASSGGPGAFRGVHPTWFGRKWVHVLEPPVRQRAKAPSQVQPRSALPLAEALAGYVESHAPYRRLVALANERDVNRLRAANPFLRVLPVRLATALLVVPAHDRRHLWQAHQVLADPAFPR
jgi:DinB superfamily